MPAAAKTRGHRELDEEPLVLQWKQGTCASSNLDETVRLQSEKRQEWIREVREERDYMGLQRAGAALVVSPAHQPRRFPGKMSVWGPVVA